MRDFELEVYYAKWEFKAEHHISGSDAESMSIADLLEFASPEDRDAYDKLWLGYTETRGAPDLRAAIATTYENLSAEHILCFAGAEEGVYVAMRVLLEPSDHAIVVVPNYQAAETLPLDICEVTGVPLQESDGWRLDPAAVRDAIRPNTKLLSINFPNNPTGFVPSQADYAELVEICREHDLYLFSDEVFRLLELDEAKRVPQAADVYDKAFSLNVMSKAYGLPGLRIGWIASRDTDMLGRFERYKLFLSICNSGPSERLAIVALKARDHLLERNRGILHENVARLDAFFSKYPDLFEWSPPDGGCVAYPRYLGNGSVDEFCQRLVHDTGVLLLSSRIYESELLDTPADRFRIGCGRLNLEAGLAAFDAWLQQNRGDLSPTAAAS